MKIGIISDIHDHLDELDQALEVFKEESVGMILNGGDWVCPYTLEYFDAKCQKLNLVVPVKSVFGNNEGDIKRIIERNSNLTNPIKFAPKIVFELEVETRKISIFHGHDKVILQSLIDCQKYDLIVTGHTHQVRNEVIGKTLVLNPGSLSKAKLSKKVTKANIAIYDIDSNSAEIIDLK
ncbi:MAG: YfcE family phosphodiesterase [Candidatus Paceibacterota bacterium]